MEKDNHKRVTCIFPYKQVHFVTDKIFWSIIAYCSVLLYANYVLIVWQLSCLIICIIFGITYPCESWLWTIANVQFVLNKVITCLSISLMAFASFEPPYALFITPNTSRTRLQPLWQWILQFKPLLKSKLNTKIHICMPI